MTIIFVLLTQKVKSYRKELYYLGSRPRMFTVNQNHRENKPHAPVVATGGTWNVVFARCVA